MNAGPSFALFYPSHQLPISESKLRARTYSNKDINTIDLLLEQLLAGQLLNVSAVRDWKETPRSKATRTRDLSASILEGHCILGGQALKYRCSCDVALRHPVETAHGVCESIV